MAIMSLREFYGGFAMGILMDEVMGCNAYGVFLKFSAVLYWLHDGFKGFACGFWQPPPPPPPGPPSHHVKAEPMLMLLIARNVRETYVLATWDVF